MHAQNTVVLNMLQRYGQYSMESPLSMQVESASFCLPCVQEGLIESDTSLDSCRARWSMCGLIVADLVQLQVLQIPIRRSASSNMLLRREMMMNCAFLVRSQQKKIEHSLTLRHKTLILLTSDELFVASYFLNPKITATTLPQIKVNVSRLPPLQMFPYFALGVILKHLKLMPKLQPCLLEYSDQLLGDSHYLASYSLYKHLQELACKMLM